MKLLVTAVNDTLQNASQNTDGLNVGIFFIILLLSYLAICFISNLMNKALQGTSGHCSDDTSFIPLLHIGCVFCHLFSFFQPSVRKTLKHNKEVIKQDQLAEKKKIEQQKFEKLNKTRTKGLTDI